MNRRGFFATLLGGATALAVAIDPEKLLWVPGKKLISVPPLGRYLGTQYSGDQMGIIAGMFTYNKMYIRGMTLYGNENWPHLAGSYRFVNGTTWKIRPNGEEKHST